MTSEWILKELGPISTQYVFTEEKKEGEKKKVSIQVKKYQYSLQILQLINFIHKP